MATEFNFKRDGWEFSVTVTEPMGYHQPDEYDEPEEEPEYPSTVCDICGRSFHSPANLKQHQTVMGHRDEG